MDNNSSYVMPGFRPAGTAGPADKARRLRRLAGMPWAEIAGRGRQEASKWIDALTADPGVDLVSILREHAPTLASPASALDVLRELAPLRFFAGVENPSALGRQNPDHRGEVLAAVSDAMHNRFDLLGYRTLWFGDPIDWHLDPVSARRAPRVHWSLLNPLDPETVGDSKVVWELNRHQWLVQLAQAHALTGDETYANACLDAIDGWIAANPPGIGVNWSSSLEVSYRLISWSWVLLLLRNSLALSGERLVKMLGMMWLQANHVARYLSYYFSPNTHLTGEALGLFYTGALFPEFNQAEEWRERGARILVDESQAQICADGVHFERSTCYHRYTAETYQQFLLLAARNGVPVPGEVSERLQRVVEFLLAVREPDGSIPEMGDADGGRLLPLVERSQGDPRGVFAVAAAMFRRSDFAWAAEGLTPDVPWLMGAEGVERFLAIPLVPPPGPASRAFPSGGYVVMRSGWERDAHQMIVDVGPLGCSYAAGHGHADLLSIQCTVFGEPCLVDAGTYCYTPEREWRNFFRGTSAHSTVMVNGRDQAEPDAPFGWRSKPRAVLREWRANGECDLVDAQHDAYGDITHRRRVLFAKPHYWVVIDDLYDKRGRESFSPDHPEKDSRPLLSVEIGFQFAPMVVSVDGDRWVRADTPGGNSLWVGAFTSTPARPSIKCGDLAPIRGWISKDYGQRTPAPLLVYSAAATLPWRGITLLLPYRGQAGVRPLAQPLFDDQHHPIGVEIESRHESIFVDESDVFISSLVP